MNRFIALIAYMAIGGLLVGPALVAYERDCKRPVSMTQASAVFATWPAWLAAALVIGVGDDGGGESSCKTPEEPK